MNEEEVVIISNMINKAIDDYSHKLSMGIATGGNNRQWTNRYRKMKNQFSILERMPNTEPSFLAGFKMCMDIFDDKLV
jgi:hypothetical protein